jgi:hypothetical protein
MGCIESVKAIFLGCFKTSDPHKHQVESTKLESDSSQRVTQHELQHSSDIMSLPKTIKRAVFNEAGGPLVFEEVPLTLPGPGEILTKVEACGVCHSDVFAQYNAWGAGFPVVPGHEIIGTVASLGEGVQGWKVGDRIGGAWHGGHDGSCDKCREGLYQFCEPYIVNGVTKDGGCKHPNPPSLDGQE